MSFHLYILKPKHKTLRSELSHSGFDPKIVTSKKNGKKNTKNCTEYFCCIQVSEHWMKYEVVHGQAKCNKFLRKDLKQIIIFGLKK